MLLVGTQKGNEPATILFVTPLYWVQGSQREVVLPRRPKTQENTMTNKITFDAAELQKMIADGLAAALAATKTAKKASGKPGRKPMSDEDKAKNRAKTDAETVKNFTAAGYKDVQPRVNVMTYNKWIENGRRVRKGEKSVKCGSFPLFHVLQTDPIQTDTTVH